MNITRENFEDNFEVMREAIRASHFIAVDAEFTGTSAKMSMIQISERC